MLVAVEGVDLTGKTTLVGELAEALPSASAMELAEPKPSSLARYEDQVAWWYDPLEGRSLVLDRSQIGEYVWPEIFRRPTDMVDPAVRRHVEMFMCSRGCVTVYATRDYNELHDELVLANRAFRPSALALALERYEEALPDIHSRGFVFEHDHTLRHLGAQDIAFVCGQADDDVRPLYGVTHRWIGNPKPRWVVAASGYSDQTIPGRLELGLHPTIAQLLRSIPERAWRGVALVELEGMSDEGLREFARLADAEAWVAVGDEAKDRVLDVVRPRRSFSPGYAVAKHDDLTLAWNLWSEEKI